MPIRMGNAIMAGPRRQTSLLRACVSTCAVFACSFGAARAADVTNSQTGPPSDAPAPFTGWYLKLGAMGVLDRSSSNLYQQAIAGMIVPGIGTVPVGSRAPAPSSRAGRKLLELRRRGHPGRLLLHPKLVGGSREWVSALGDSHHQRIVPDRASLGHHSQQIASGLCADNRRLSFHPVRPFPALSWSRHRADLRFGDPRRLQRRLNLSTRAGHRCPRRFRLHAQPALGRLCRCEAGLRRGDGELDGRQHGSVPGAYPYPRHN